MDFETTEQALAALDNITAGMAPHPSMASLADVQRRAVSFLRERLSGAQAAATTAKKPRR